MTDQLPASSITQTWQVGPRRPSGPKSQTVDDSDHTQTIFSPRYLFVIEAREARSQRTLELGVGSHSFFREKNSSIGYRNGRDGSAEFEINIHKGGAFYVDVNGTSNAKVNGRLCHWARLRSGDVIHYGLDTVRLEYSGPAGMEETIASPTWPVFDSASGSSPLREGRGESSNGAGHTAGPKPERRPSFPIRVAVVLLGGVSISLFAAYIGYSAARVQRIKTDGPVRSVIVLPTAPAHEARADESARREVFEETVKPQAGVGKFEFEASLDKFKHGEKAAACQELMQLGAAGHVESIWSKKAALFVQRRCE